MSHWLTGKAHGRFIKVDSPDPRMQRCAVYVGGANTPAYEGPKTIVTITTIGRSNAMERTYELVLTSEEAIDIANRIIAVTTPRER